MVKRLTKDKPINELSDEEKKELGKKLMKIFTGGSPFTQAMENLVEGVTEARTKYIESLTANTTLGELLHVGENLFEGDLTFTALAVPESSLRNMLKKLESMLDRMEKALERLEELEKNEK